MGKSKSGLTFFKAATMVLVCVTASYKNNEITTI